MRITVIINDAGMAANIGGAVETYAKSFDMPDEISRYIKDRLPNPYIAVHLAVEYGADEKGGE